MPESSAAFHPPARYDRNWSAELPQDHPEAQVFPGLSPTYSCHGLTFASRRTKITDPEAIANIIADDRYDQIDRREARPGDVIVYYRDGEPTHCLIRYLIARQAS
jgi:hypothetical protein